MLITSMKSAHLKVITIAFLVTVGTWVALMGARGANQVALHEVNKPSIIGAEPQINVAAKMGPLVPNPRQETDDPAIWIHPTNPSKSFMILSDKYKGMFVFDFNGNQIQQLQATDWNLSGRVNNIDLRKGFKLGNETVDVVAGNFRDAGKLGMAKVNPNWGGTVKPLEVIPGTPTISSASYGFTLYKRKSDGQLFMFDQPKSSAPIKQWKIDGSSGTITTTFVRDVATMGVAEGYVADDDAGLVYFTEEGTGIHKYNADPDNPVKTRLNLFANGSDTKPDREGLTLYACNDGTGYLILSNQGYSNFKVYNRQGNNELVKTFTADKSKGTDGLDVTAYAAPGFPNGFAIIQNDASTAGGATTMSYYVYDWASIAQSDMKICPNGGGGGPTINPTPTNNPTPTIHPTLTANPTPTEDPFTLCDKNAYSINNPAGWNFTEECLQRDSVIYQNDNRFTFFGVPTDYNEISYIKTPNNVIKDSTTLSWSINLTKTADVYVFYRKIPGQTVPSWLSTYTKVTPAGYADLPQHILRKNELGLIGVYDIYRKRSTPGNVSFGAASTSSVNAYSMYITAIKTNI